MSKADARQIIINGSATKPRLTMSPSPKRIPKQIIPNRRIFLILKSIPTLNFSEILNMFPTNKPIIIANIIEEIGLLSNPIILVPK